MTDHGTEPRGGDVLGLAWRKARRSNPNGACVELAPAAGGRIAVRDSKNPAGAVQYYAPAEIAALLRATKAGEHDDLIAP